jgi:hypothetical protein
MPMNLTRMIRKNVQVGNFEQAPLELAPFDGRSGSLAFLRDGRQHRSEYSSGLKVSRKIGGTTPKGNRINRDPDAGHGYITSCKEVGQTGGPMTPRGRMS